MNNDVKTWLAVATVKSFGDFVIAHSILHKVEGAARARVRLIAGGHLRALNCILPDDVRVTFIDAGETRVPALFDVKKRGPFAALQSGLSLRRAFQEIERNEREVLIFDAVGVRERFIAGRWPVMSPRAKASNIYNTYYRLLAEQGILTTVASPTPPAGAFRSVGLFPESRLIEKRLSAATLAIILDRIARVGLDPKLFILDGDVSLQRELPCIVNIPRNFESLAAAIRSVSCVISADSLPAHLAEYLGRPVFVAAPAPNEYWLPRECFNHGSWGIFRQEARFSSLLDRFLAAA